MFTATAPATYVFAEGTATTANTYEVGENKEYKTINDALKAVEANPPAGESTRATINIDPGTYEEQVVIGGNSDKANNLSYVTIQKTPGSSGEVKWS